MAMFFVLDYDEADQRLLALDREPDGASAMRNRRRRLAKAAGQHRTILVMTAPSEDAIRVTHSRYFQTLPRVEEDIQALSDRVDRVLREDSQMASSIEAALAHA